ncbi:MAG: hypothetical protein ACRDNT_31110 [Streptosporangiaceae bacterium]
MQSNRGNAVFLRTVKNARYLWPVPGSQPKLNAALNALPWQDAPVAAATSETVRGRTGTRAVRVLPCPAGAGFAGAEQALLIERHTTYKKKGQWLTRAGAVLYLTSLAAGETTPEDLLAHVRGHWRAGHAHWLRDKGLIAVTPVLVMSQHGAPDADLLRRGGDERWYKRMEDFLG